MPDKTPLYGITEKKKAYLDEFANSVLQAQRQVEQHQAIVDSLTLKATNFQNFLSIAENSRALTYNNKELIDQMASSANNLAKTSEVSVSEISTAQIQAKELATTLKQVMDKLIYTAERINLFANIVVRQKMLNPLVSDNLINMVSTASADANNAVALTLVALQSTFAGEAANLEAEAALGLEYTRAREFLDTLTKNKTQTANDDKQITVLSLKNALHEAYTRANTHYHETEKASNIVTQQLAHAQAELAKAQIKLSSFQAGLAAANAAALAL